jgi:hypothetical protein
MKYVMISTFGYLCIASTTDYSMHATGKIPVSHMADIPSRIAAMVCDSFARLSNAAQLCPPQRPGELSHEGVPCRVSGPGATTAMNTCLHMLGKTRLLAEGPNSIGHQIIRVVPRQCGMAPGCAEPVARDHDAGVRYLPVYRWDWIFFFFFLLLLVSSEYSPVRTSDRNFGL